MGYRIYLWYLLLFAGIFFEGLVLVLFVPLMEMAGAVNNMQVSIFPHAGQALSWFGIPKTFAAVLAVIVLFSFLKSVFLIMQGCYGWYSIATVTAQLKRDTLSGMMQSSYRSYLGRDMGFVTNVLGVEFGNFVVAMDFFFRFMEALCFTVLYWLLPLAINPMMTFTTVALGLFIYYFIYRNIIRRTADNSTINSDDNTLLQSMILYMYRAYAYLRATNSIGVVHDRILGVVGRQRNLMVRQNIYGVLVRYCQEPVMVMIVAGMAIYFVNVVGYSIIAIVLIIFLIRRAMGHSMTTSYYYHNFLVRSGSLHLVQRTRDDMVSGIEIVNTDGIVPDFDGTLHVDGVQYEYEASHRVLDGCTMSILPNTTVAIVGPSGAGKSTLMLLLMGLLNPTSGSIRLGNTSYLDMDVGGFHCNVGYVSQEGVIFNDTVRNNITMWDYVASDDEVRRVLCDANLETFVGRLPEGLDTMLGDDGINMSGGERQKVNLARELYRDVRLLILDEPTSHMDPVSDLEIQRSIGALHGNRTVVIVSHRLSTIMACDGIFVLKGGCIIESGTYDELRALDGEFAKMIELQQIQAL